MVDDISIISEERRFQDWDLKNTRNLKKYDCWDDDLEPDEWVKKSKEELGENAVHC